MVRSDHGRIAGCPAVESAGGSVLRMSMRSGFAAYLLAVLVLLGPGSSAAGVFSSLSIDFLGRSGAPRGLVAEEGTADNPVWNPAGLSGLEHPVAAAGFMDYLVGLRGGLAGYAWRPRRGLGLGVYVSYLTSGDVLKTGWDDPLGELGGTFSYGETVAGFGVGARVWGPISWGGSLKAARQTMDGTSSSGLLGDLALGGGIPGWSIGGAHLRAVLVRRNLVIARWGETGGDVPAESEIGLGLAEPVGSWTAGFSLLFGRSGRREGRVGVRLLLADDFEARLGYRRRIGVFSDGSAGFAWHRGVSAGFGVRFGPLWLDYGYEDSSPLDGTHRFSLRTARGAAESN
jgi:hypothetical protein